MAKNALLFIIGAQTPSSLRVSRSAAFLGMFFKCGEECSLSTVAFPADGLKILELIGSLPNPTEPYGQLRA